MNSQLYIPKILKVGYQWREDTYTKKLAYVTSLDDKGKLRKEKSWRGWIHDEPFEARMRRSEEEIKDGNGWYEYVTMPGIPVDTFDNVPTEGFVLNRNGGGGRGWDGRNEFIRVWDPRGFEFEIGIANLLFILQESNSYRGKGLDGQFIYSWSGADLVLLPCSSQEYISSTEFNDLKTKKVSVKTLIEGATYYTKSQEKAIYMGKHPFIESSKDGRTRWSRSLVATKQMVFKIGDKFRNLKGKDLADVIDPTMIANYAELMDELYASGAVLPIPNIQFTPIKIDFEKLSIEGEDLHKLGYYSNREEYILCNGVVKIDSEDVYPVYNIIGLQSERQENLPASQSSLYWSPSYKSFHKVDKFRVEKIGELVFDNVEKLQFLPVGGDVKHETEILDVAGVIACNFVTMEYVNQGNKIKFVNT